MSNIRGTSIREASKYESLSSEQLVQWLDQAMLVLRSAAGSSDYWQQAVEAVDQIIGLDYVIALQLVGDDWKIRAMNARATESEVERFGETSPSSRILCEVRSSKATICRVLSPDQLRGSLMGIEALVVAPILDSTDQLIGALYGVRKSNNWIRSPEIAPAEVAMVEIIAGGTAAGISREAEQHKAMKTRIQFEQFFTPELVRELEQNPELLDGQERDVTVLFCDVANFSATIKRLGSRVGMRWINSVMDELSNAVFVNEGVVVDYIGDEIMAMWGAPKPQGDHAIRACDTAMQILELREAIDALWYQSTEIKIDFRIGICSGKATVGNIGSHKKFKYGPLGDTVNIASRIQGVGKFLEAPILASSATLTEMKSHSFRIRPLGTVRVAGFSEAVPMCELISGHEGRELVLAVGFEQILDSINQGKYQKAVQLATTLSQRFPADHVTQKLLEYLTKHPDANQLEWDFSNKPSLR
jgi:adenylate cyclase